LWREVLGTVPVPLRVCVWALEAEHDRA